MSSVEIKYYRTQNNRIPYEEWISRLKDVKGQSIIDRRIMRIRIGNFGDHRFVGKSVWEIRIHYGPGYRIYYVLDGYQVVILLCGGDKRTQRQDIVTAQGYAEEYRSRK